MRTPHAWLAFLILLLLAVPANAQRTGARVRGSVADSSGAVIPGATVTLHSDATGLTRTTTTNESGLYSFGELPVGTYSIKVELQGFKTGERTDVQLNVADDRAVDFALDPGQVQETVSVEASAVQVKTIGGDVSGVVTGQQVRELPLNGRNFLQLATLMPGVSAPDFLNVKDKGLLGGSDLAVSGGSRHRQPVDRGRREQQRRRLQPHDSGVPVGGRHRGVQDPPQQLRPRVRPIRRRADQHRHAQRQQPVPGQRPLLRAQRRA